ncbi:MAG: isocitrate/isopropylmalate dehydrogenase family protein [Phycisphaerales bacterium JB040]
MTHRIAILPGDGIGPEVLAAARRVLDATGFEADYIEADIGWNCWTTTGEALPAATIDLLRGCNAALFGAITSKPADQAEAELPTHLRNTGLRYESPIVRLRREFDLYQAVRPCRTLPNAPGPAIDVVVFRENTEGLYAGIEWRSLPPELAREMASPTHGHPDRMQRWIDADPNDVALSTRFMSRRACERIAEAAFAHAANTGRSRVTLLEKPNVLRATGGLMTESFRTVAKRYPAIEATELNIDAACMRMVQHPETFDVIVAENMFGDIVSDLAAGLAGGLGLAPSANIGDSFAVFEPVHGSAPDIAGRAIANPCAAVLSAAMMLDWLSEHARAADIQNAVHAALAAGEIQTPDLHPHARATTQSATDAIIARLTTHAQPAEGLPSGAHV